MDGVLVAKSLIWESVNLYRSCKTIQSLLKKLYRVVLVEACRISRSCQQ
jgi:acetolactate synthase regulatory subunit